MSCSPSPELSAVDRLAQELLATLEAQFYAGERSALFPRDRKALLHALTWPAHWLERRALFCPPQRYRRLIAERLTAIQAHGDPAVWQAYFPRYLLKCLQDFFHRHGDDLYHELKHISHAVASARASIRYAEPAAVQARQIAALALAHRLLQARAPPTPPRDSAQLSLFS